ncbi:MAG: peptidase [Sphingomonas sp. SCN 67-18]|uniref:A24 family peptidase n=1 Tax=uncultured Sphingomonas sp. TaxID=158754 RepID=UPI00086B3F93|nr:prepilin peptidase [Sphingomonas sp. SCN 67-18]ODU20232.1 MAG: peptidase [Sphingomonas sp. SCN 67-18]
MTGGIISIITLCALAALLLTAAATDIRNRTISNGVNAAIALIAPLYWWSSGMALWPDMAIQIGLSVIVFAVFAAVFAAGMMGGGDVKLLAALALWLPLVPLMRMLMVMAIAGGVVTLVVLALHKLRKSDGNPEIPYGVAIAFAGLWAISERYLNQFA